MPFGQLSNNDIIDRNIIEQSTFDMDREQDPLLNVDSDVNILYLQNDMTNMSKCYTLEDFQSNFKIYFDNYSKYELLCSLGECQSVCLVCYARTNLNSTR